MDVIYRLLTQAWCVVAASCFLVAADWLAAQPLPSEATLPGQRPVIRNLPAESSLPGVGVAARTAPPPIVWPAESLLPAGFQGAVPGGLEQGDDELVVFQPAPKGQDGIGARPAGRPWLRLNMDGHTGLIQTLTFSPDSARLYSAGEDKMVEVWGRLAIGNGPPRWVHERAVRWQVSRGPRGRIHRLATAPNLLALAGHGAMGGNGEILLVDPVSGEWKRALYDAERGHRQPVLDLSFSPSGTKLASQDVTGRALLWQADPRTGLWSPRVVGSAASDTGRYGADIARRLVPARRAAPIAMVGEDVVILPKYHSSDADGRLQWALERVDGAAAQGRELSKALHYGMVLALAASADGAKLVSSDTYGLICFWDLTRGVLGKRVVHANQVAVALSFSANGQILVAAGLDTRTGRGVLQLWDVRDITEPTPVGEQLTLPDGVYSAALSPDGRLLAFSQGGSVEMRRTATLAGPGETLQGRARPVRRVAFAAGEGDYRIAVGTRVQPDGSVPWERSFNLSTVQLEAAPQLNEADGLSPSAAKGTWSIGEERTANGKSYWLRNEKRPVARLPLFPELHGEPTAACWIADAEGQPYAVAVGTLFQGNIFVFRLAAADEAQVLRQFRGHEAAVRSLGVSRDRRYLVSGSDDATVRIWNLEGFDRASATENRWGAEFEVRNGELAVAACREDGPLYFSGVRPDDIVRSLAWREPAGDRKVEQPAAMLAALQTAGADQQILIDYRRRDLLQPSFQRFPAWEPLVSLYVAENREWAFWTPAGYYDASFDGHKLFGWQVNRGLELLPEFFLAAQFQRALERPRVMERLLSAGSLEAAFRAANQPPPGDAQNAVLDQYRLKPRITIVAPRPDAELVGSRTTIEATIAVRAGLQLAPPKAFANGVVATNRRLLEERAMPGGRELRYAWDATLPSDKSLVIQVVGSTEAAVVDTASVTVRHRAATSTRPHRLYIVAAGVNEYHDAQIQRLDYAAHNARAVVDTLRQHTKRLYSSEATLLLDGQVTRPLWTVVTRASAEQLRHEVQPDDLLVFFLSGHGVQDPVTQEYYFVASNARFDDVKSQRFSDCLSFADLTALADVPCRKLAVLDTCHSGAVQELSQRELKGAIRALQADVMFTLTASEGTQEAAEQKDRRLGRFTSRLLEALTGAADESVRGGDGDGIVSLQEVYRYVTDMVAVDSQKEGHVQHPTVGPIELIDRAVLPLTRP